MTQVWQTKVYFYDADGAVAKMDLYHFPSKEMVEDSVHITYRGLASSSWRRENMADDSIVITSRQTGRVEVEAVPINYQLCRGPLHF